MAAGTLPVRWVTGDEGYGADTVFLDRLAALGLGYGAEVPHSTRVWPTRPEMCVPPAPVTGRPPTRLRRAPLAGSAGCGSPAPRRRRATHAAERGQSGAPVRRLCGSAGGRCPARPARPRGLAAAAPPGAHRPAQNLSDTGSGAHDDGATGMAGGDAVADRNLLSGRQAAAGPGGLRRTQLDRLASPHDSVSAGPLFPGAADTPAQKKAPALTVPQMCRLLAAILPRPRSRLDHTLQILGYQGARNPAATRSHALRRRNRDHPP